MSMKVNARSCLARALLAGALASGCGVFGATPTSTVAQGQYYASGDPYYDQFFVDLYLLQVGMAEAPKVPEAERQRWVELLQLDSRATPAAIELRLHEEALKLAQAGIHLRLDQSSLTNEPQAASTTLRSNARPKENPAAALLAYVESSSTTLLRSQLAMKQREEALGRLELMTIRLDAGVDRAFSQAPLGKPNEVKENLADAHKLIPLMRARARAVSGTAERLLAALTHGIDTDDGSLGPPLLAEPKAEGPRDPGKATDGAKPTVSKPRPKAKPASAPAARPKPAAASDDDAPAKPRAPSGKSAPPPRDFEP